ncbi:MAG: hypothetical protein NTZ52_07860 [Chlamydiae bacterium]|nr:hypothetical protein [Chlamydiota bacterium]
MSPINLQAVPGEFFSAASSVQEAPNSLMARVQKLWTGFRDSMEYGIEKCRMPCAAVKHFITDVIGGAPAVFAKKINSMLWPNNQHIPKGRISKEDIKALRSGRVDDIKYDVNGSKFSAIRELCIHLDALQLTLAEDGVIAKVQGSSVGDEQLSRLNTALEDLFSKKSTCLLADMRSKVVEAFKPIIHGQMSGSDSDIQKKLQEARGKVISESGLSQTHTVSVNIGDLGKKVHITEVLKPIKVHITEVLKPIVPRDGLKLENDGIIWVGSEAQGDAVTTQKRLRTSDLKKEVSYQATLINGHVHRVNGIATIRSGAAATHGMGNMGQLLTQCEKDLGLESPGSLSTSPYKRYREILNKWTSKGCSRCSTNKSQKDQKIADNINIIRKMLGCSVYQMCSKIEGGLQARKEDNPTENLPDTVFHFENSLLSPTDSIGSSEESLFMQLDMAMEYINERMVVNKKTSELEQLECKEMEKEKGVKYDKQNHSTFCGVLASRAVNEYAFSFDQHELGVNQRSLDLLIEKTLDKTDLVACKEQIPRNSRVSGTTIDRIWQYVKKLDPNATFGVCCKSGKDRTGQAVADRGAKAVWALKEDEVKKVCPESMLKGIEETAIPQFRTALQAGLGYTLTGLNTKKPDGYAFNLFQLKYLPSEFRPHRGLCNESAAT